MREMLIGSWLPTEAMPRLVNNRELNHLSPSSKSSFKRLPLQQTLCRNWPTYTKFALGFKSFITGEAMQGIVREAESKNEGCNLTDHNYYWYNPIIDGS